MTTITIAPNLRELVYMEHKQLSFGNNTESIMRNIYRVSYRKHDKIKGTLEMNE